jgi:ribosomal protein L7/L12
MTTDQDPMARSQIEALRVRVAYLEQLVRQVYDHLGLESPEIAAPPGDDVDEEILSLLRYGKDIHAIKTYRVRTGADLTTAKATIDRLKAQHGI